MNLFSHGEMVAVRPLTTMSPKVATQLGLSNPQVEAYYLVNILVLNFGYKRAKMGVN